jgi:phosphoserine aminotransferase
LEVAVIEKLNNAKAALLYAEIDRNPLFKGAAGEDRSMNATFLLNDESHAATFDVMWKAEGMEYQDTVQWVVTELQCTMHYQ